MKHIEFVFLILASLGLIQPMAGQTSTAQQSVLPNKEIGSTLATSGEVCDGVSEGLQLCTPSKSLEAQIGESVPLDLIFKNRGEGTITFGFHEFFSDYQVSVIGPDGNPLKSRQEIFDERVALGTVSEKEFIESLPINTYRKPIMIEPSSQISRVYSLEFFYEFTVAGLYKIDIARRLPSGGLAWLPTVELTIKPKPPKPERKTGNE